MYGVRVRRAYVIV